jgi:hypothetical protein
MTFDGQTEPVQVSGVIPFAASTLAWLRVTPNDHYLTADANECVDIQIQVTNHGTAPLTVTGLAIDGPLPAQVSSVIPVEALPWQGAAGQTVNRTVHICLSDVCGAFDAFGVVLQTGACVSPGDDRIAISGSVCSTPIYEFPPPISESDDLDIDRSWVVWHAGQIFAYDIAEGAPPQQITSPPAVPFRPRISGDLIVWDDRRDWDGMSDLDVAGFDVYLYDRLLGQ